MKSTLGSLNTQGIHNLDRTRLDFRLLQTSGMHRFGAANGLKQATITLESLGYKIFEIDAYDWSSDADVYDAFSKTLGFPAGGGRNLDALNDWLHDFAEFKMGADAQKNGSVLSLRDFDRFASESGPAANALVSILADLSRYGPIIGHLIIVLLGSSSEISYSDHQFSSLKADSSVFLDNSTTDS